MNVRATLFHRVRWDTTWDRKKKVRGNNVFRDNSTTINAINT